MNVAIIPARIGSQRIPKKNVKPFVGTPIIAYSISVARETKLFDRIIVSTDSKEIARVVEDYGAEVPFMRPMELADDYTGTDEVALHALKWLLERGESVEYICCIYATAPFIQAKYICQGYEILRKQRATSAFAVSHFSYPIFRALKVNETGNLEMFWPQYTETRSQDLPDAYQDAAQFYWAESNIFLERKSFLSENTVPIVIPRHLVHDIDTHEDWEVAELVFKALYK